MKRILIALLIILFYTFSFCQHKWSGIMENYFIKKFPDVDNLFRGCESEDMEGYSKPGQTTAHFVLKQISNWILVPIK